MIETIKQMNHENLYKLNECFAVVKINHIHQKENYSMTIEFTLNCKVTLKQIENSFYLYWIIIVKLLSLIINITISLD